MLNLYLFYISLPFGIDHFWVLKQIYSKFLKTIGSTIIKFIKYFKVVNILLWKQEIRSSISLPRYWEQHISLIIKALSERWGFSVSYTIIINQQYPFGGHKNGGHKYLAPLWAYEFLDCSVNSPPAQSSQKKVCFICV